MMTNESKLTKWTLIICFGLIAMYFAAAANADDMEWSGLGNSTNENFLAQYIEHIGGDEDVNNTVDRWIDGWMDGVYSVYAYDKILTGPELGELYECVQNMWPAASDSRRMLLKWGSNPDLKDQTTSSSLYWAIRIRCEDVLGPVDSDTRKSDPST
jgi:hypothetical protein